MSLQPKQFSLYQDHMKGVDPAAADDEVFQVGRKAPNDLVEVHGTVNVAHNPSGPYAISNWNDENAERRQAPSGQQHLFKERYMTDKPGKSVVEGMDFTKAGRALALPVLAVAERSARERYGRGLTPSTDRSEHSEKLVQNLAGQGIIEGNERKQENSMSFSAPAYRRSYGVGEEQDPAVLQKGKADVRAMIRSAPGRKRRTDGVQDPLF